MKPVASRANEKFKALRLLASDARAQRRSGTCLIDGAHLVAAYCARRGPPERLIVSERGLAQAEIAGLVAGFRQSGGTDCLLLEDNLFASLSELKTPGGIMAQVRVPEPPDEMPAGASCLLLEAVQDAGNVGAILRSAAAAGLRDDFLGPGCASAWMPRALRAAQGAHFDLAIREQADLLKVVQVFRGAVVAATAQAGEPLFDLDLSGPVAWLFGNEGAGVTPALLAVATRCASIPMAPGSESLNVAAAAAVCLFEELRQKRAAASGKR